MTAWEANKYQDKGHKNNDCFIDDGLKVERYKFFQRFRLRKSRNADHFTEEGLRGQEKKHVSHMAGGHDSSADHYVDRSLRSKGVPIVSRMAASGAGSRLRHCFMDDRNEEAEDKMHGLEQVLAV